MDTAVLADSSAVGYSAVAVVSNSTVFDKSQLVAFAAVACKPWQSIRLKALFALSTLSQSR